MKIKMKPYTLLYPERWKDLRYRSPRNIKIVKGKGLELSKYPQIRQKIDKEWVRRKKGNQRIFSSTLCRLSGYSIKNDSLVLELGETNYKELVGTNYLSVSLGKKEENPYKYFSMALSVSAVVETKDDYVLITRRSEKVESCKNTFHTIAGQVEPEKLIQKSMASELRNEAGLEENEYKLCFAGLIMNNCNLKPELIFVAKSKANLIDILLRKKIEAFEAELMFGIKKKELKKFLNSFPEKDFCPPGLAAWQIYSQIEKI